MLSSLTCSSCLLPLSFELLLTGVPGRSLDRAFSAVFCLGLRVEPGFDSLSLGSVEGQFSIRRVRAVGSGSGYWASRWVLSCMSGTSIVILKISWPRCIPIISDVGAVSKKSLFISLASVS